MPPQHALGQVTRAAARPIRLHPVARFHPHARTDAAAVGPAASRSPHFDLQPVAGPAPVAPQQLDAAVVVRDQDIEAAVIVKVAAGGAAADLRDGKRCAGLAPDLIEAAVAAVAEEKVALGIGQVALQQLDVVVHVPVGDEGILQPVIVHVKEEEAEAQRQKARGAKAGRERHF